MRGQAALARGERPHIMCPLNLKIRTGICGLYKHRLMICRMHGVPNVLIRPDGQQVQFPGCYRCQELTEKVEADGGIVPVVNRTSLYKDLVMVEMQFVARTCGSSQGGSHHCRNDRSGAAEVEIILRKEHEKRLRRSSFLTFSWTIQIKSGG